MASEAIATTPVDEVNETNEQLVEEAYEMLDGPIGPKPQSKWEAWKTNFRRRGWILLFILPAFIYVIIFCYVPM